MKKPTDTTNTATAQALTTPSGYRSPAEIIREHDERRMFEGNRAGMTLGGCRASKSFKMENGKTMTFEERSNAKTIVGLHCPIGFSL